MPAKLAARPRISDIGRSSIARNFRVPLRFPPSSLFNSNFSSVVTASNENWPVSALSFSPTDTRSGVWIGRQEAALRLEEPLRQQSEGSDSVRQPGRQAERIDLVAAVKHRVGKARATQEHSDDRPLPAAVAKRDEFARHGVRREVRAGELDQPFERLDRVAPRAEIERDQVGLAARQHRNRRRLALKIAAVVNFGQRGLHSAVAAVDRQHLRPDAGDDLHRLADLVRVLDLVMEDVRVIRAIFADARQLGEIACRFRVGKQGDTRARSPPEYGRRPAPRAHFSVAVTVSSVAGDFTINSRDHSL